MVEHTAADYVRLGDEVRNARLEHALSRQTFAETVGISVRTLSDIENGDLGKRKEFSRDTLAAIESALGWFPGATRAILSGDSSAGRIQGLYAARIRAAHPGGFSGEGTLSAGGAVGGTPQDSDQEGAGPFLYKRPEGLTDEQWRAIELRGRAYLDGLIEGASHER